MDTKSRTATTTNFAPEPVATLASNMARELFKENCVGLIPETDKEELIAIVTVSLDYEVVPKAKK